MDGDSDSEVPEYSLPPKSIVKRPRKSTKKSRSRSSWRKYCRKFCHQCSSVLLVLVIVACVLSIVLLFWFSCRLYRDMENLSRRLTIEINRVKGEQGENIEKCNSLTITVHDHVQKSDVWHKELVALQKQIGLMNDTLNSMSVHLQDANSKVMLKTKVDALQKGMADTGAEMTKLGDQVKHIEKEASLQISAIRKINSGLQNISEEISNSTGRKIYHSVEHILNDLNQENVQPQNSKKTLTPTGLASPEVMEIVNTVNQSLFSKILILQSQTGELKLKFNSLQSNGITLGNISRSVHAVRRHLLSVQQLLDNLSSRVHNLTTLRKVLSQISVNTGDIRVIWNELKMQNSTLLNIQQTLDQNVDYRPGIGSQDLSREKKRARVYEELKILPGSVQREIPKQNEQNEHRSQKSNNWQRTFGSQ